MLFYNLLFLVNIISTFPYQYMFILSNNQVHVQNFPVAPKCSLKPFFPPSHNLAQDHKFPLIVMSFYLF